MAEEKKGLLARLFKRGAREEPPPPVGPEEEGEPSEAPVGPGEPEVLSPAEAQAPAEPVETMDDAETEPEEADEAASEPEPQSLFQRLRQGLSKTHQGFVEKIDRILFGRKEIDQETLDELEEALVTADLGVQTSLELIDGVRSRVARKELTSPEALRAHLKQSVLEILIEDQGHFELGSVRPYVLMVIGVNGVGKTTTIGKLAARFASRGARVVVAAGDTFRAAAIEQLEVWAGRAGAQVVRHQHGSDPAAVAFDAVSAAQSRGADLVIIDTAGRLHTKANLMEELKKVKRVVGKGLPGAPHEVLLVLDATTGQNAIQQARIFHDAVGVDSIALTKLDGTAKGGVIVGICNELKIPVKFIGIGEQADDLRPFDARAFVDALF